MSRVRIKLYDDAVQFTYEVPMDCEDEPGEIYEVDSDLAIRYHEALMEFDSLLHQVLKDRVRTT